MVQVVLLVQKVDGANMWLTSGNGITDSAEGMFFTALKLIFDHLSAVVNDVIIHLLRVVHWCCVHFCWDLQVSRFQR